MSTVTHADALAPIDPLQLRRCLGQFVTGVAVITTLDADGQAHGMTVNSFASVSLDPPLVLWSLRRQAWTFGIYEAAPRFVVNVLAEDQQDLAMRFAKPIEDRFAGVASRTGLGGVPLLDGCLAHLECTTQERWPGGDHLVFLGQVQRMWHVDGAPLAYSRGGFATMAPTASPLGLVAGRRA